MTTEQDTQQARRGVVRAFVILIAACLGIFAWEWSKDVGRVVTQGEVVQVEPSHAGRHGDDYQFQIRFEVNNRIVRFTAHRGVIDHFGRLATLREGDSVEVTYDPSAPHRVVLNTLNDRYPVTLATLALALIFGIAMLIQYRRLSRH